MYQFILFIHVLAAVLIVALVLVQQGKGATVGAAFGSGASQTMFGSRGSGSFLFRLTMGFIALFFITSIALNNLAMKAYKQERVITVPATPVRSAPVNNQTNITAPAEAAPAVNTNTNNKTPASPAEGIPARKK